MFFNLNVTLKCRISINAHKSDFNVGIHLLFQLLSMFCFDSLHESGITVDLKLTVSLYLIVPGTRQGEPALKVC